MSRARDARYWSSFLCAVTLVLLLEKCFTKVMRAGRKIKLIRSKSLPLPVIRLKLRYFSSVRRLVLIIRSLERIISMRMDWDILSLLQGREWLLRSITTMSNLSLSKVLLSTFLVLAPTSTTGNLTKSNPWPPNSRLRLRKLFTLWLKLLLEPCVLLIKSVKLFLKAK